MRESKKKKHVFVVGFEGTVVGDLRWAKAQRALAECAVGAGLLTAEQVSAQAPWAREIVAGLVRPHFAAFAAGRDVFVRADADVAWLVGAFEEASGVAFRRPILGPAASLDGLPPDVDRDAVVVVDASAAAAAAEWEGASARATACPTYKYVQFCDPFESFPPTVWRDARMQRCVRGMFPKACPGGDIEAHYKWCLKEVQRSAKDDAWRAKDDFWQRFRMCGSNKRCRLAEI